MDKKQLSERDICTQYITPALVRSGWDIATQVREEFSLTNGRILVRGKLHTRARNKRADYVLFYKPNLPIAVIEAKDNTHSLGNGMQQGLGYGELLQVPFIFSSNGDGFLFHNKIATDGVIEREIGLDEFPSAETLWQWWAAHRGLSEAQQNLAIRREAPRSPEGERRDERRGGEETNPQTILTAAQTVSGVGDESPKVQYLSGKQKKTGGNLLSRHKRTDRKAGEQCGG